MLLAFTDYSDGMIYPFTSLRKVRYKKGCSSIELYCIGDTGYVYASYGSVRDALNAYNQYIQYLTVPNPSSSPI